MNRFPRDERHHTVVKRDKVHEKKGFRAGEFTGEAAWAVGALGLRSKERSRICSKQEVRVKMSKEDSQPRLTSCLEHLWFLTVLKMESLKSYFTSILQVGSLSFLKKIHKKLSWVKK